MLDRTFVQNDSRNSPRFALRETLSVSLVNGPACVVRGDVKDLSELGARVLTDVPLARGEEVTIDVQSGYSLLFRAEARIVWRADVERRPDSQVCAHGIFFTELSSFSRKLIRRLSRQEAEAFDTGQVSDSDLEALFPRSRSKDDRFDLLSDPVLEWPLYEQTLGTNRLDAAELSGSLGYFTNTDVLQMLESTRATGILHVEGEFTGEIHLRAGRICGCFSHGIDENEAVLRLIVADRGRFHFVPSVVDENLLPNRSTTRLLLEAHLRRDADQRFAT
jgi:hypothetical protein